MVIILKIFFVIITYLVGSIPFGLLFGLFKGVDIREHGSHNIGTTNTGRVLGQKYAILTYACDMGKGALFVALFRFGLIPSEYMILSPLLYGVVACLGHTFSIYLGFKGGKAVATGSGMILGYAPLLFLVCFAFFFLIMFITKRVSVGSLSASLLASILSFVLVIYHNGFVWNNEVTPYNMYLLIGICLITSVVWFKHVKNMERLFMGTESKVGFLTKKSR